MEQKNRRSCKEATTRAKQSKVTMQIFEINLRENLTILEGYV